MRYIRNYNKTATPIPWIYKNVGCDIEERTSTAAKFTQHFTGFKRECV
jgi:hypothetical protein